MLIVNDKMFAPVIASKTQIHGDPEGEHPRGKFVIQNHHTRD